MVSYSVGEKMKYITFRFTRISKLFALLVENLPLNDLELWHLSATQPCIDSSFKRLDLLIVDILCTFVIRLKFVRVLRK